MRERRIGVMIWLPVWAAISAIQLGPLLELFLADLDVPVKLAWLAVWQVIKGVPTVWRLNDLGRAPDDAVVMILPIFNFAAFFGVLMAGTPSARVWERRRASWYGRMTAGAALVEGARLAARTAPLGIPVTLVFALISALGGRFLLGRVAWAQRVDADTLALTIQVLAGIVLFLGVYTLIQFGKRETASRASWVPSLFAVPLALVAGGLQLLASGMGGDLGPVVINLMSMGWVLWWQSVGGGFLAVAWIALADHHRRGEVLDGGDLWALLRTRGLDVAGPHGARTHAVTIGMQVIIPGIFYATQLAFTDMVAVLEPDRPALKRSARLTWGMRSRIFKLLALWAGLTAAAFLGTVYLLEGAQMVPAAMFDPNAVLPSTFVVQELVMAGFYWICELALLAMYWERLEIAKAAAARKAEAAASATEGQPLAVPADG